MKIKLLPALAKKLTAPLAKLGIDLKARSYDMEKNGAEFDLAPLKLDKIRQVATLVEAEVGANKRSSTAIVLRDINLWIDARQGKEDIKLRNVQQFASIITERLRKVPGHRVYKRTNGLWYGYYVVSVNFYPGSGPPRPSAPSASIIIGHLELGSEHTTHVGFSQEDVVGKSPLEALRDQGYLPETDELRGIYLRSHARYEEIAPALGKQFHAVGTGTDDLDGNPSGDRYRHETYLLEANGRKSRIVIDVVSEEGKSNRNEREKPISSIFWSKKSLHRDEDDQSDDEESDDDTGEVDELTPEPFEIPVHPIVACFDLRRHLRLRIHVANLIEYVYNENLGDSLVIPEDDQRMVDLLLSQRGDFKDIIEDKGGGAIVLCAGPPGVGKTLTAEIYSEVLNRPLYSVQCSQLGTTPTELEAELLKVFARSQRWNAILLLDEADVYVYRRGNDIDQNAIVGVFLRVLEYYSGTMFLTTNRADLVDDAIAQRCVARIDFKRPSKDRQRRIWRVLSGHAGLPLTDAEIASVVDEHPNLSGRTIRSLLKLVQMGRRSKTRVGTNLVEEVTFMKRYLPTIEDSDAPSDFEDDARSEAWPP